MNRSIPVTQRGSIAIVFVGLFLPLLYFLFSLSIDVSTYYADQTKVQSALDETALYAYRFLPNVSAARNAALAYSGRYPGLGGLTVDISSSTVTLKVERRSNLTFAKLVGVTDASLPLSVASRVRGVPVDGLVVLDTSAAVAPSFSSPGWGEEIQWSAAQYFDDLGGVSARSKTQRCFNPIFSPLKLAAINTYRYLGASSVNSVGLGFYRGVPQAELVLARDVSALPTLPSDPPEVSFVGFSDPYVGPSLCAAAAENENYALHYRFSSPVTDFASRGDFTNRPNSRVLAGSRSLNPEYAPYLQGEELIWSQAASDIPASNFSAGFRMALMSLLSGERSPGRGGLSAKPSRTLLWLAGDLPREGGIRFGDADDGGVRSGFSESFAGLSEAMQGSGLTIFFVVIRNPYNGVSFGDDTLLALQRELLGAAGSSGIPEGLITVRVFGIESSDSLVEQLSRWMAMVARPSLVAL